MTVILAFSAEHVAKLTDLTARQLRYWDDTDFFHPSFQSESGKPYGRVYSFRDVVSLRVLSVLRKTHQVSLQELRRVGKWLAGQSQDAWASSKFYVSGRRVFFHDPRTDSIHQGTQLEQTVIPIDMREVVEDTKRRADLLTKRKREELGKIVQHRYVSHNAPVLAGTRIRTSAIWSFHEAGYSCEEIIEEYPRLTREDVHAAIRFEAGQRQAAS